MTPYDPAADGWLLMDDNDMPAGIGPVWRKPDGETWRYGLWTRPDHANPAGAVHGGILVAFADHTLGCYVDAAGGGVPNVTIQLNSHFLAAVEPGAFLELRGEVTRTTGSMVFVRGIIAANGVDALAVDGIWRIFRPRKR